MAEWINTANGLITLITGLLGLIGTATGAYFAIKNWISALKTKNSQEIWTMIMSVADAAMKEAESSILSGETKKQFVIDSVKVSCKAANIDLDLFIDKLSEYIDQTIDFVNKMNLKK